MGKDKILDILIIGAGNHARVVANILRMEPKLKRVIGFIDDNETLVDEEFEGLRVLGTSEIIQETPHDALIVAIGKNENRARTYSQLLDAGEIFVNAIHPSAVIDETVSIGKGVVICAGVVINPGAVIHDNVILNTRCTVDHDNIIHDHVHVAPGCTLGGDIVVGEGTLVGIGSTVMPQLSIGSWSKIGAGAVVIKNIPDHVIAFGVPAEIRNPSSPEGNL